MALKNASKIFTVGLSFLLSLFLAQAHAQSTSPSSPLCRIFSPAGAALLATSLMLPQASNAQSMQLAQMQWNSASATSASNTKVFEFGIASGALNQTYNLSAKFLAYSLPPDLFHTKVFATAGSMQNIQLYNSRESGVRMLLIQSDAIDAYKRRKDAAILRPLQTLAVLYKEQLQMFCTRNLNVTKIDDLVGRAKRNQNVPIFVAKDSGSALTMTNLKSAVPDDWASLIIQPVAAEGDTNAVEMSLLSAMKAPGGACAAMVARVPSPVVLKNIDELSRAFNLVDTWKKAVGRVKSSEGEEMYDYIQYSDILAKDDPYQKLLLKDPANPRQGSLDPYTWQVGALLAVDKAWWGDVMGYLKKEGMNGTADEVARVIKTEVNYQGNFSSIADLVKAVPVEQAPAPSR